MKLAAVCLALATSLPATNASAAPPARGAKKPVVLTVYWHSGVLADALVELAKEYTAETGVVVRAGFAPYGPEFHDRIAAEFAARSGKSDLVVFDSQSMSEFASQGHVVQLNELLASSARLEAKDFDPVALRQYGEYPEGSGKLYALPLNQDCFGLVYRRDLLEDPAEKAAFKARYGRELAVPKLYRELREVAEFFTRPERGLWGLASYGSPDYDAVTSPLNGVLWSFGGELWDPASRRAEGVLNSPRNVAALSYYKGLFAFMPPGATGWFHEEVNRAVLEGRVAMALHWYYFFRAYADPRGSAFADRFGYAPTPGEVGMDGKERRFVMVGGQGISLNKYGKRIPEAWRFLEWLMTRDVQTKWAKAGAQTGRTDVLTSPEYARAQPYNDSFPDSMHHVKDYWHLVEYPRLLSIYQRHAHRAITGAVSPKEALDAAAREHQEVLDSGR